MGRYFIQFSYDGTAYHGWQRQPNGMSVQEVLENALSTILRQPIEVVGAGRTDAGVHARMMVAHFDLPLTPSQGGGMNHLETGMEKMTSDSNEELVPPPWEGVRGRLNKLLPHDIAVQRIWPVADDMHARFSATSRTYHYYIHTQKDPFLRHYSWQVTYPLDFDRMNEAAACLLNYEDFTSFSKTQTDTKTNICHITEAKWTEIPPLLEGQGGGWVFTITANRFLRNMVRAIVGTLIEVGRGRMTVEEFCQVIEQKNRCSAGESVPGHALFLTNITYPTPTPILPSVALAPQALTPNLRLPRGEGEYTLRKDIEIGNIGVKVTSPSPRGGNGEGVE